MTQLALDIAAPAPRRAPKRRPSIEERFAAFHEANPQVYEALLRLAREARAAGSSKLGAKALWERCRWDLQVMTSGKPFRLDNSLVSLYARKLLQEPDLAGLFETRERTKG